jgi:small neutral amino acid transporter SnatA (MarC family)
VNATAGRIRLAIAIVAATVLAGLLVLRWLGIDRKLLTVLAIAGGLLVTLLFVTYRALLRIVETARANPHPPPQDDDDDEDDR